MTGPGGGSRDGRKPDGDETQGDKVTLLDKWKWMRGVVADRAVPREALATGFVVADLVSAKLGYAYPGQDYIAGVVGVSKTSVNGHLKKLASEGHLGVKRRGRAGPSHYRLLYKPIPPGSEPDEHEFKPDGTYSGSTEPDKFKPDGTYNGPEDAFEFKAGPIMNSSRLEPTKPRTKRSENPASPFLREPEARKARQADDVDKPASPVADRPQVVSGPERREADRRWADAVGPNAIALLAKDPDGTDRLWTAIAAGRFTVEDVDAGIGDWTRNGKNNEPRFWGFFERWAEAAAQRRSARAGQPDAPTPAAKPAATDGLWTLVGGVRRTMAFLEAEVARWDDGYAWDEANLGDAPDSKFTSLPRHLWRSAPGVPRPIAPPGPARTLDPKLVDVGGDWVDAELLQEAVDLFWDRGIWNWNFGGKPGTDGSLLPDRFNKPRHVMIFGIWHTADDLDRRLAHFDRTGHWPSDLGEPPGSPRCELPARWNRPRRQQAGPIDPPTPPESLDQTASK